MKIKKPKKSKIIEENESESEEEDELEFKIYRVEKLVERRELLLNNCLLR